MENKTHRFISTKYELYSMEYGNEVLIEKTEENRPLTFYTGWTLMNLRATSWG